jgi:non-heme chloroperoxidase
MFDNSLCTEIVALDGDRTLPCVRQGDATGTPLLLLHGYTDSWRSFTLMLPHLPHTLRVIAPTQRGHGGMGGPAQGYTPADFATDAVALLDALGVERAVVVGHSMGSQIALRLALDHPDRVHGLVLIGGFAALRQNTAVRSLWDDTIATLRDPVDWGFVEGFQRSTIARPVPASFLDMAVRESLKVPAAVWRAALSGMMEADLSGDLRRITAPTLLLWGDRDAIIPRSAQTVLTASIPDAHLVVLPGTGHAPNWEEPARAAAEIVAFVRTTVAEQMLTTGVA